MKFRPRHLTLTAAIIPTIAALLIAPKFRHYVPFKLTFHTVSMSNLPTNATSWTKSRLTSLYEGVSPQDVIDQVFSPTCEVRVDHVVHPLQTFKDDLLSRRALTTHVSVAWDMELISTNDDKPEQPAVVAGALVVTRSLPFRIRAGPAQRLTHVHFSAKIEQDASVQEGDQRRITSFYYTSVDRTPPIHFAVPHTAQEDGSH